jgi:hypothetical protein
MPKDLLLEQLEANQAASQQNIATYLHPSYVALVKTEEDLRAEIQTQLDINNPNSIDQYTQAIHSLHELRDKRRGINWVEMPGNAENGIIGTRIRDAREQSIIADQDSIFDNKVSHQIEMTNFIRTSLKLLDIQGVQNPEAKRLLAGLLRNFNAQMDILEADNYGVSAADLLKKYYSFFSTGTNSNPRALA